MRRSEKCLFRSNHCLKQQLIHRKDTFDRIQRLTNSAVFGPQRDNKNANIIKYTNFLAPHTYKSNNMIVGRGKPNLTLYIILYNNDQNANTILITHLIRRLLKHYAFCAPKHIRSYQAMNS